MEATKKLSGKTVTKWLSNNAIIVLMLLVSLIVGIMQGLGAEIGFAIFAYKSGTHCPPPFPVLSWASAVVCTTGSPIRLGARCALAFIWARPSSLERSLQAW